MTKTTRALCAVVFLMCFTIGAAAQAARAGQRPRIAVEPVLVHATDEDDLMQIRVSVVNGSSEPIVIDPDGVHVFSRPEGRRYRSRHAGFSSMMRLPCKPAFPPHDEFEEVNVAYASGTTMVWSTPEPHPTSPPAPREAPTVVDAGTSFLSAPEVFGAIGCEGAPIEKPADIYAVVEWHAPGSRKRRRIVSDVIRVAPPSEPSAR